MMSVSDGIDDYVPGILDWAEMYDVAGLNSACRSWRSACRNDCCLVANLRSVWRSQRGAES